ncbi:ATP-grasp domain-containing protein [Streptomyces sp. NPDC048266]|uniref:ATP-grasp domain-containing protein n=1 Tax=Streptomyces sp. NPDC048266 TaxID=3155787 RepID=UPI0033D8BA82
MEPAYWYGGPVAGARVAGQHGFALLEPPDNWFAQLPEEFTGRDPLGDRRGRTAIERPTFVKPPRDKSFPADIYADGSRLPADLAPATAVLFSEVVTFAAGYRLFLLDGQVTAGSRYALFGRLDPCPFDALGATAVEIAEFVDRLVDAAGAALPSAVVVDVGQLLGLYPAGAAGGPSWRPTRLASPLRMPLTRHGCWTWRSGRPGLASG